MLDPVREYAYISEWIVDLIGKKITPRNFGKRTASHLIPYHPVRVKVIYDDVNLDEGDFTIGAEYDSDLDERGKKQFIINLIINQPKHVPWLITADIADRFTIDLVEALVHEYQHQHQYRIRRHILNRGYKSQHQDRIIREDEEYLGNPDEVDAYAANIAARFYILRDKLNSEEPVTSFDLQHYYKVFGPLHPVVKRLRKKISKNLEHFKEIDTGKRRRKLTKKFR